MDEKLRIHVPHEERNDRLPWAYRHADPRPRAGDWWVWVVFFAACALAWGIVLGIYWLVKVLP